MPRTSIKLDGISFDSNEEVQFYFWLSELRDKGICSFERTTESVEICPPLKVVKGKNVSILRNLSYTPDFKITWNKENNKLHSPLSSEFVSLFYHSHLNEELHESIVDVKGAFASQRNSTGIKFPLLQKVLAHYNNLYVNKIIPEELFRATFVPQKLLLTKTGKTKKWNFNVRSLDEYWRNSLHV